VVQNNGKKEFQYSREKAIAQMLIHKKRRVKIVKVEEKELSITKRGTGGFGSTNKRSEK
jgi:dUTPase